MTKQTGIHGDHLVEVLFVWPDVERHLGSLSDVQICGGGQLVTSFSAQVEETSSELIIVMRPAASGSPSWCG